MFTNWPNSQARLNDVLQRAAKFLQAGNAAEAVRTCREALVKIPGDVRLHYALGVALAQSGQTKDAIAAYQRALQIDPNLVEARVNLGTVFGSMGQLDNAIDQFSKAAQLRPNAAEVYANLSNALRESWRIKEAIAAAERAVELKASLAEASLNLGAALASDGQFDRAIAVYRKLIQIRPDLASAHMDLGLAELVTGNLLAGWPEYEWRQQCAAVLKPRQFSQPTWRGEDLAGKTILLYAEQGLGDAIHFIRYVAMVAAKGAKVIVECPPTLVRLFQTVPGIERILPTGQPLGDFDVQCALPSLPGAFKTTLDSIPATIPYLKAEAEAIEIWRARIVRSEDQLQIGLAWAGSAENRNDRNRSIGLEIFSPLTSISNARFHSLQINPPTADPGFALSDWSSQLTDFADTAGLVANMDLIISVDTSVAHLAAAMGKPVWLLVPFPPDWRWMLNRTDSPWYPTLRLFRQDTPGNWDTVIQRVTDTLAEHRSTGG